METYGKILVIAMPIFLLLIIIEKLYGYYKGNDSVPLMDAASSISSGITNAVKDVLGISLTLISYSWLVSKLAIFHLQANVWAYIIGFIVIDFYGYWVHRLAHQINFFWNKHVIHHSSEEFNLACALRQSISSFINLFTFLLIPAAIVGVPASVVAVTIPIHLFMQFWYHTKHINKMGFLEKIIVTPSHHRVHHAINPEYMDKNYGQIFIFWDKIFGSFKAESDDVPPVYGITRPAQTWNPIRINFQHLWLLVTDTWHANKWKDKLAVWYKPTGWRPHGFEEKYPVYKIKDVNNYSKYESLSSPKFRNWIVIQVLITLAFVGYFFNSIAAIGLQGCFIYGAFVFLSIYSNTELMDGKKQAIFWEVTRFLFGLFIIIFKGDWFGLNIISSVANYFVILYLFFSLLTTLYFVMIEFKNKVSFT